MRLNWLRHCIDRLFRYGNISFIYIYIYIYENSMVSLGTLKVFGNKKKKLNKIIFLCLISS